MQVCRHIDNSTKCQHANPAAAPDQLDHEPDACQMVKPQTSTTNSQQAKIQNLTTLKRRAQYTDILLYTRALIITYSLFIGLPVKRECERIAIQLYIFCPFQLFSRLQTTRGYEQRLDSSGCL